MDLLAVLRQDDTVKDLLAGCAGLEGECQNAGVRPEALSIKTRGLGDVPELLESEAQGLGNMPEAMPKGATYWMRENPPSVDAQCRAKLKAESCDKAGSADICVRLTRVGVHDMGVVRGYAEGCAKHSAAVTRAQQCARPSLWHGRDVHGAREALGFTCEGSRVCRAPPTVAAGGAAIPTRVDEERARCAACCLPKLDLGVPKDVRTDSDVCFLFSESFWFAFFDVFCLPVLLFH
jgi:hypothetical protein